MRNISFSIPDSYMLLTCAKCAHTADFFDFCRTPITGALPSGTHQCPNCKKAWRMESQGNAQHYPSGLTIPATRVAVTIPTIL
jgi:hypothetical protein